jgi:type III secretion protein T
LQPLDPLALVMLVAKEVFVGFVMGALLAIPFLAFEALGFLIDNQRGASISATLNPLTGNDSSPLGLLFNQAFIVFFLISGAFLILLDLLYGSFQLWPVFEWTPTLRPGSMPFFIEQLMQVVNLGLLLAAPAIVAMLLAEIGLALISLAVPQLQVFFLAMPIKSALVLLLLLFYLGTLFEYGGEQIERLREIVPLLHEQWRGAGT